jgi:hypothetical protein
VSSVPGFRKQLGQRRLSFSLFIYGIYLPFDFHDFGVALPEGA